MKQLSIVASTYLLADMIVSISSGKHTFKNLCCAWLHYLEVWAECRQHHLVASKRNPLRQQHHISELLSGPHSLQLPEQM